MRQGMKAEAPREPVLLKEPAAVTIRKMRRTQREIRIVAGSVR